MPAVLSAGASVNPLSPMERCESVAGCNEDILHASFAFKQSRKAPVCNYPKEQRCKYGGNRAHDVECSGRTGAEDVTLTDGVVVICKDGNDEDNECTSCGAALFMLQIPESVERMEDNMERI